MKIFVVIHQYKNLIKGQLDMINDSNFVFYAKASTIAAS